MKQQPYTLTKEESAFAAEHHDLIYTYLNERHLSEDEFYDVMAFGFLNGVRKYFRREDLQEYKFTNISWRAMDSCLANNVRSKCCLKRKAEVLSLQDSRGGYTLEEIIADAKNTAEEAIQAISLQETLSRFEETDREIVRLLMDGYPRAEIKRHLDITFKELGERIRRIRETVTQCTALQVA